MTTASIDIERALTISGYMSHKELSWLAGQAGGRKRIAEIGSWMGRSTRAMAENTTGIVYAVDTWLGSPELMAELKDKPSDWLFNQFRANTKDLLNIRVYPMPSIDAAHLFKATGVLFDMIFIDGAHDFDSARADILAWRPLLAEHGLFCGHDYLFPTVAMAVDELVPDRLRLMGWDRDIWYVDER